VSTMVVALADMPLVERELLLGRITDALVTILRGRSMPEDELIASVSDQTGRFTNDVLLGLSRLDVTEDANGQLSLPRR
jgi:hypothetical protein